MNTNSVFAELSFWFMAIASVAVPIVIYAALLAKRAVSRTTVLVLGITLVAIAGLDIYFLRHMAALAATTASLADDALFLSELSFALYLFPLMFGGIGVNLISHVLISHLIAAERRFEKEHHENR
ncbi:hypothetical protein [Variovorax rhizosphaerae]|uniref:Uncharacterized protein n=1 Tax=Variovorax rhizosphaerae TaxID=1836200 RepID=A0ABU8WGW4_9BURK